MASGDLKIRPSEARRRLEQIIESDPANLRRLGWFTQSGEIDPTYNMYIYILLVIVPALLLVSLFFFCAATFDAFISGSPSSDIQA